MEGRLTENEYDHDACVLMGNLIQVLRAFSITVPLISRIVGS